MMDTSPGPARPASRRPARVFMLGATGTIGKAAAAALLARGHELVCLVRPGSGPGLPEGAEARFGHAADPVSLARDGFRGEPFDVLVSCMASRTGVPEDAWAIDYRAHAEALALARASGVRHMVLLSAICVQKPVLAFQKAKLAFERDLMASGLAWSIVRPTAYFKSLSGQVARVLQGKPYLLFGDGTLTACKPISDGDLGRYLALCLEDEGLQGRILPVGGPGEAITPRQQGEHLFALTGQAPRFREVPVALLDAAAAALGTLGRVVPGLAAKAELARIGRYYATESMLVRDPVSGHYDADATPSYGSETLFGHYARLVRGEASAERGAHAVF